MWLKQKLGVENADNLFARHGFVKRKDSRRKVRVSVNGEWNIFYQQRLHLFVGSELLD